MTEQTKEAGRELDALIATRVFGWRRRRPDEIDWSERDWVRPDTNWFTDFPAYSTDIAAAFQVVQKMTREIENGDTWDMDLRFEGDSDDSRAWRVDFALWTVPDAKSSYSRGYAEASAAPLAICRAALYAMADYEARRAIDDDGSESL